MLSTRSLLVSAAVALTAASPAFAQRTHLGLHGGYNTDSNKFLVGGQAVIPITRSIDFYPSVDYHFVDAGSLVGVNIDLRLRNPYGASPWYAGGGLTLMRTSVSGSSDTQAGADIFAGLQGTTGAVHPYAEIRGLLNRASSIQLVAGLNFTLY